MQENVNEDQMPWQLYEDKMLSLCQAKADDFRLLGYDEVTAKQIWDCVMQITKQGKVSLHQMVTSILGLQIGKFMNVQTMNAYKGQFSDDPV